MTQLWIKKVGTWRESNMAIKDMSKNWTYMLFFPKGKCLNMIYKWWIFRQPTFEYQKRDVVFLLSLEVEDLGDIQKWRCVPLWLRPRNSHQGNKSAENSVHSSEHWAVETPACPLDEDVLKREVNLPKEMCLRTTSKAHWTWCLNPFAKGSVGLEIDLMAQHFANCGEHSAIRNPFFFRTNMFMVAVGLRRVVLSCNSLESEPIFCCDVLTNAVNPRRNTLWLVFDITPNNNDYHFAGWLVIMFPG